AAVALRGSQVCSEFVISVDDLRWALRSGPVVVRLCCPSVWAGRIDDDMAGSKRRRHTPDQIIRKLAEGNKL
ncbi:hypothetical protein, partial [Rhodococcus erythropolis]|uniref:hypothetical protein n=1 Tax=Rhodococcus erythropolis TaxID=1833 RepID=UPI0024B6C2F4